MKHVYELTFRELLAVLSTLSEDELRSALNYEVSTYRRQKVISRLHQRYTKLRAIRERDALVRGKILL